ncbi:MAG TPA: guanylate kinase [Gammaproteobacteria bacterium]|nr:guanylate kinase [Gammaproteobacteria bacterium]
MPDRARGKLVVIAAPSGAGKTTLVHALLAREPGLRFSISYTTRPQRAAEADGQDYFFVDTREFERMRDAGEFLEWAQVFDHCYGTSRAHVESLLAAGHSVLLEIDWQGAAQIRAAAPEAVSIFVLPPSRRELERRLRGRGTDPPAVIERRLADAVGDMGHWREFDYVVVNDDLEAAVDRLVGILRGGGEELASRAPAAAAAAARLGLPELAGPARP